MAAERAPKSMAASRKDCVVVLAILPFVQMMIGLYIYSCLPLHMIAQGLDLIYLGFMSSAALWTRMVVPLTCVRFVALEKLLIPSLVLALGSGLLSSVFPDSAVVVCLNIYFVMLLPCRSVYQAAVVQVWPSDRTKALRLYEGFYTIGYCLSSLWGAALYHSGGWRLCVWCQAGVLAVALVLASTVGILRPSCPRFLERSKELPAGDGQSIGEVEQPADGTADKEAGDVAQRQQSRRKRWSWCLPLFICVGSGILIFAYASEWCIYLVFFTETFQMSPLVIGIGQMAGDTGGAVILLLSIVTDSRPSCTTTSKRALACCTCLCSLPFSMAWLGILYALSYLAFLSPEMGIAISGQVAMGTLYVLMQQGCNEMVDWCSRRGADEESSDRAAAQQRSYQGYAAMADACFSGGCCLGSILPYVILDKLSAAWVCYLAAGLVAAYYSAFALVFSRVGGMEQREPGVPPAPPEDVACES